MNLGELRTNVRTILDLNADEFSDAELDLYAQQATDHIRDWTNWTWMRARIAVTVTNADEFPVSTLMFGGVPLKQVASIETSERALQERPAIELRQLLRNPSTGDPMVYAIDRLAQSVVLLHPVADSIALTVEGLLSNSSWTSSATAEPEVPANLHMAVLHWMLYRCYARLGDGTTAAHEMDMAQVIIERVQAEDTAMVSTTLMQLGAGDHEDIPYRPGPPSSGLQNWRLV